jgi:predicted DsbA family dithiol-disulfide isomerase
MKIEIVSDVVCPWCIVGYKQLAQALQQCRATADIHWQPFELNPNMPIEGQNLQEHMVEKYGSSKDQSDENRQRLTTLGSSLGIKFNFSDDSRIVNTFRAHQLLHWAGLQSHQKEHELKLALFQAYFTDGRDVSDENILIAAALSVELDGEDAISVLQKEPYAFDVRQRQKIWIDRGVRGVPSMLFSSKYLVTGAQGIDNYVSVINQVLQEERERPE